MRMRSRLLPLLFAMAIAPAAVLPLGCSSSNEIGELGGDEQHLAVVAAQRMAKAVEDRRYEDVLAGLTVEARAELLLGMSVAYEAFADRIGGPSSMDTENDPDLADAIRTMMEIRDQWVEVRERHGLEPDRYVASMRSAAADGLSIRAARVAMYGELAEPAAILADLESLARRIANVSTDDPPFPSISPIGQFVGLPSLADSQREAQGDPDAAVIALSTTVGVRRYVFRDARNEGWRLDRFPTLSEADQRALAESERR